MLFQLRNIGKETRRLVFVKFVKTCHELDNRERIRDKPTYWTINGEKTAEISAKANNFILSFRVKCDPKATTYIAFTYPYSYKELQMYLSKLDRKYGNDASFENIETIDEKQEPSKVYFHRELAVRSLLNFRVDLLTITDSNGMTAEREAVLENLFPDYPHSLRYIVICILLFIYPHINLYTQL